ncbi:16531_t:CDS:2 [Racocetra fulgida]|uniref:16531_t:CDS:1 n=1 Tax=Racocetra fulgida TaxID=60492 RepID=A0A9N8VJ61_9GLOM|nr:16531_t:CDS:2 [Racocetra fulgida]
MDNVYTIKMLEKHLKLVKMQPLLKLSKNAKDAILADSDFESV